MVRAYSGCVECAVLCGQKHERDWAVFQLFVPERVARSIPAVRKMLRSLSPSLRREKKAVLFVLRKFLLFVLVAPAFFSLGQLTVIHEGKQSQLQPQAEPQPLIPWRSVSFESLNVSVLQAKSLPGQPSTWSQTSSSCGIGAFTPQAVALASAHYGLYEPTAPCGWGPQIPVVAEWGYEFMNNQQHIFPVCGNLTMAAYAASPTSRQQAVQRLKAYWQCRAQLARGAANASASDPVLSIVGHYLFSGLAAEFEQGAVIPGAEIGENINSIQVHTCIHTYMSCGLD